MTLVSITKPEIKWKINYDQDLIRSALIAELIKEGIKSVPG